MGYQRFGNAVLVGIGYLSSSANPSKQKSCFLESNCGYTVYLSNICICVYTYTSIRRVSHVAALAAIKCSKRNIMHHTHDLLL